MGVGGPGLRIGGGLTKDGRMDTDSCSGGENPHTVAVLNQAVFKRPGMEFDYEDLKSFALSQLQGRNHVGIPGEKNDTVHDLLQRELTLAATDET